MNVAVVFYGLPPEGGGGFTFQQTVLETLERLGPLSRHRFTYYAADGSPAGHRVIEIPSSRLARYERRTLQAIRDVQDRLSIPRLGRATWFERSLQQNEIEFVWFASHYVEDCTQPFICTIWDLAHVEAPWFPEVSADGEWERRDHYFRRMLPKAARVIMCNQAGADTLARAFHVPSERILQLPMPTPEFAISPPAGEPRDLSATYDVRPPYLFYPAQFWAHKNHYNALRAVATLNARRAESFQLVLVGSDKGQLDHVRSTAAALGVQEHVRLLGFVDIEDLIALYRGAHALLYLSFFGPENLPPLEALALGCPVVCADVAGMREQLGEGASYVPPTDINAIADAVEALGDEEVRAHRLAAGSAITRERTATGYVERIFTELDAFEPIRRTWA
jgi:glycosyltransferase involved in cell wall biosynthesis